MTSNEKRYSGDDDMVFEKKLSAKALSEMTPKQIAEFYHPGEVFKEEVPPKAKVKKVLKVVYQAAPKQKFRVYKQYGHDNYQRDYYAAHRDKFIAKSSAYRLAHKDEVNKQARERYWANREARKEYNRQWAKENFKHNKERIQAQRRNYRAANKVHHSKYKKEYYEKNKETLNAARRAKYAANKPAEYARFKAWYNKNKAKQQAYYKDYYHKNRAHILQLQHDRRVKA